MVNWEVFFGILVFSFGLFTLLAGLFTAYFGAGKSRAIGFVLTILGIAGIVAFIALTWAIIPGINPVWDESAIVTSLMGVFGAAVGAVAALLVFLISIMKA